MLSSLALSRIRVRYLLKGASYKYVGAHTHGLDLGSPALVKSKREYEIGQYESPPCTDK